ncbi:MAG: hypothetical protein II969_06845 [Anaerolineaceae bacterium]|nr:hypothetical protein [Anaerolineaceae bacterium]
MRNNTKKRWKKLETQRIDMPDYPERAVNESLVNTIIHRDYLDIGSEIHVDIFDDRMEIYSPGGMFDGTIVQNLDTDMVLSKRRNPVIADLFDRMHLMERRGSGFKKINEDYRRALLSRPEVQPKYYSNHATFIITLFNLNYGIAAENIRDFIIKTGPFDRETGLPDDKTGPFDHETGLPDDKTGPFDNETGLPDNKTGPFDRETGYSVQDQNFLERVRSLVLNNRTRKNIEILFEEYGLEYSFGRAEIMHVTGLSRSSATELLTRLKLNGLIIPAEERNKYHFTIV